MNSKVISIIITLLLNLIIRVDAQQTGIGKMHSDEGTYEISFKRSTNFNDNTTKYIILQRNSEIFEVVFQYDMEADTILVYWIDRRSRTIGSRTVKFLESDTKVLVSNYELNAEVINESPTNLIIFSIDGDNQFITLYQFQPTQGSRSSFELQPVPPNIKTEHQNKVADYNKTQQVKNMRNTTINDLKKAMLNYRDSMITVLEKREKNFQETTIVTNDETLKARFVERMDTLFKNHFRDLQVFAGTDSFNVYFQFICKGTGMINVDTTRSGIFFRDGQVRTWFRDSFILYVKPEIESAIFETSIRSLKNSGLLSDFDNHFKQRIEQLDSRGENIFQAEITQVRNDLSRFEEKELNVSIRYTYEAIVKSQTKYPEWKYSAVGDLTNKSEDRNKIDINEELQKKFKLLNLEPGGRYTMEHCVFYINDQKFGPHIRKSNL